MLDLLIDLFETVIDNAPDIADVLSGIGTVALSAAAVAAGAAIAFAVFDLETAKKFFREVFARTDTGQEILKAINQDPDTQNYLRKHLQDAAEIRLSDFGVQIGETNRVNDGQYVTEAIVYHRGSMVGCPYAIASEQRPQDIKEGLELSLV